ncbi:unnamed protein product [Spodoptera littoralis]|uniref:Nucleoporin NSP1-like C-terminal domain-containing protein n=1 Tax=Spodoptera littoralis TaxID=7109 RepID=A0A9P0N503_SPOLI|nr:unnamed protein product [Spodoptera littoralis]CAH1641763.1 unnamed protein product [Spodoptera littoralis]
MSFNFGSATTTAGITFGTNSPSTGSGFAFGSGDAAKQGLFGAGNAENKPAFNFASPSGGGFSFGAAKTTAAAPSVFSTPVTSSAAPAFGASKPVSFGGFASPPNQTVGSPGFPQSGTTAAAPTFGTPTTQATTGFGASPGTGFGFGQSATTQPSTTGFGGQAATTGFGSPPATTGFGNPPAAATTGFGFSTPASGFSAPQPQASTAATTTSAPQPTNSFLGGATTGFGQSAFGAKPGSAFSFGGGNTAAPAFGTTPATTTTASAFGQKPTLGFGASSATTAPTSQTTTTPGQTGLSSGIGFGQTTATTAPTFGTATPSFQAGQFGSLTGAQQSTPINFSTPSTQPQTGLSFAPPSTAQPTPSLGFATTTQSGLTFGGSLSTPATTTATSAPSLKPLLGQPLPAGQFPKTTGSLSFAPATVTPSTATTSAAAGLGAWSTPLTTTTATGLGFATTTTSAPALNFGTTTTTSTLQTGFGLTSTAAKPGINFGKPITSVAASSAASTTAPSGIIALGKTTATTTMASLTTATTTTAAAPPQIVTSITFAQLEENINKWTLELEDQEKTFINQATQINAWDRLLIANGEKIVELNDAVQTVKNEQQSLEHELDFVLAQQKELEDLLAPMEKQLSEENVDRLRDPEREHMYSLAENLDTQLRQMSEDLKEVIEHLNETNRSQDSNDPIVQIGRILNAHMSSMQWIDNSIAQISTKLDQLKATHDTLRRDNERSYQLTYN